MGVAVRVTLGEGLLTWPRGERVGDRYGLVVLMLPSSAEPFMQVTGHVRYLQESDEEYATFDGAPVDQVGRLVAEVVATAESGHIGDLFHGLFPETPEVGEEIVLGHGRLFTERAWKGVEGVGLRPLDRSRKWGRLKGTPDTFWLDPRALYRCHEQTVRLYFEEA